jgi:hypothetical protein
VVVVVAAAAAAVAEDISERYGTKTMFKQQMIISKSPSNNRNPKFNTNNKKSC